MMPKGSRQTSTVVQTIAPAAVSNKQNPEPELGDGLASLFVVLGVIFLLFAISRCHRESPVSYEPVVEFEPPRSIAGLSSEKYLAEVQAISPKVAARLRQGYDKYKAQSFQLSAALLLAKLDHEYDSKFDPLLLGSAIAISDGNNNVQEAILHSLKALGRSTFVQEMHQISSQVCIVHDGALPKECGSMCIKEDDRHLLEEGKQRPFGSDELKAP